MASGGEHSPSKRSHPSAESANQSTGFSDHQWTFPNNLELNTHSKTNRKHKNKEKIRSKTTHEVSSPSSPGISRSAGNALSFHTFPRSKLSTASWLKDQLDSGGLSKRNTRSELDEETSDIEQGVKHRRNFNTPINQRHQATRFQKSHGSVGNDTINVPVNQRHQSTRFQNAQGNSRNDSMENENSKPMKQDNTKKLTDSTMLVERLMQLHELIAQVNSILKNLEKSDEPVAREYKTELGTMIKKLTEEERAHINLLQQIMACDPNVNGVTPPSESSQAKGCFSHRDLHRNEEDKTNKQNHFLEQVKESQEKLTALKEQQAILVSLQKQAEDKLAAFHAQILKSSADQVLAEDWQYASSERSAHSGMDEGVVNGDSEWENDVYQNSKPLRPSANLQKMKNSPQENIHSVWQDDSQASSHTSTENRKPVSQMIQEGESENYHLSKPMRQSTNSQKMKNSVQDNMHSLGWQEEPQASGHHSAETHKSVSQIFQELSDNKNMTEQLSADESELTDAGDSLNDLEWRRKRLKNKLTELREKQLQNDQLKRELASHNETAKVTAAKFGESDDCLPGSVSQDNQQFLSMSVEQNKRKLEELQETIMQLSGFMNGIAPAMNSEDESSVNKEPDEGDFGAASSRNFPASQNIHHVAPMKRENIRKEQSSGFPARRHYEAEGRANEDPDVPSVAPPAVSPTPNQNSWEDDPRIQQKIRKLKEAKDKLKKIQGILNTIQEYKESGRRVPVEYLQLLQSLAAAEKSGEYEACGIDDDNEEVKDDETDSLNQSNENEAVAHSSKLVTDDVTQAQGAQTDNIRLDQVDLVLHHKRTLESLILERERLLKIHEQFMQLRNSFPSLQRNNDKVRSSGEGGNLKKKRTLHTSPLTPHSASDGALTVRLRQDNLLTRQNIATMESQNRNKSNALGTVGESVTAKKENINNLSSKVTKHTLPNSSVRSLSESVSQDNNDVSSTFSAELNHSLSLRDELQHKVALDDLLSEDRSKQQGYHRNQDNQARSCSSVNSETLEGSNSVFAPDNTVAATWGGSSTQENFEDETEDPVESLEEQEEDDDDDENNNEETSTVDAELPQNSISNQFSNVQYVHTGTSTAVKQRDKALQKDFRGSHLNQWNVKKNLAQCVMNRGQTTPRSSRLENFVPEDTAVQVEDGTQPSGGATDGSVNSSLPSNFVQQLEQLNALCQSILQEQQSVPQNLQRNIFSCPLSNTAGRQPRSTNDVMHHYTQQLQLQQQLLLSLSQCYHALYVQQLEIQHLHRCVQHNTDPETALHNPSAPPAVNSEDFTFRPWFLSPWLSAGIPSMPHQQGQMPSMCVPPLLQPQQSFNFGATPAATASAPPCALVSGMQSARPVPNTCNQEVRTNAETLNNQVPPRTRANNFLDNFRSCSRQNLLSASSNNNIKSNETGRTQSVSQIRPVAPLSSNTVSWNQRAPEYVPAPDSTVPTYHAPERTLERPPANPELQELMTRTKKPNLSKPQTVPGGRSGCDFSRKPSSSVNIITPLVDNQSTRSNPFHSVNMDNLVSSNSNIGTRPLILHPVPQQGPRTSALGSSNSANSAVTSSSEPMLVSIFSEVSKLVAHNSLPPDSLMELFQELQNLRSDGLLRALSAVKELARTERTDRPSATPGSSTNEFKNRVDTKTQDTKTNDPVDQASDSSLDSGDVPDGLDSDEPVSKRAADDAASHWNSSTLPTATIPPFGKAQVSKASTGAVKKRTLASRSVQPYSFAAGEPQDVNNGHSLHPSSSATKDISETLVERIIHDVLSCLHDHVMDECCPSLRSKISSRILDALKANSSSPLPLIFLSNLKQTLNLVIAKYSGLKVSECESDLLKSVAEVLFKELTHQRSASQRPVLESGECSSATPDVSNQPDVLPQTCKLSCGEEQKKHPKEPSEMSRVDANLNYAAVSTEGTVDLITENCPSSTVDENSNSFQQSGGLLQLEATRGAVGGENSYATHASNWSSATGNPEEDMGYECDPEAEAEPEVEIGTEADLAEADQSPGQQGVIASSASGDGGHLDAAASGVHSYEENGTAEVDVPVESGAQALPDSVLDQEIGLDDIPTKLTPLSEEELQKQMKDEQEGNSVLSEVVEDFPLVGDSSAIREPASFLPDSCGKR